MKKLLLTSGLVLIYIITFSQIDRLGFPAENASQTEKPVVTTKSSYTISPSTVINQIPAPMQYIADITFDGHFVVAEGYNEYKLFFIDPATGVVDHEIPIDIKKPYGLGFANSMFYVLDNQNNIIKLINPDDGTVIDSILVNDSTNTYLTGLAAYNNSIWYNDAVGPYPYYTGDKTKQRDISGQLLNYFDPQAGYPSGLTFDGQYLWVADNESQLIHQIDVNTFQIVKTIEAPGGIYPNGLAWDGQYLWVANNDADSIYQVDVGAIATNVDLVDNNKDVVVYPNPANSYVNIKLNVPSTESYTVEIFNAQGKLVKNSVNISGDNNVYTWDINSDADRVPGMYFCVVTTSNNKYIEKIVVN